MQQKKALLTKAEPHVNASTPRSYGRKICGEIPRLACRGGDKRTDGRNYNGVFGKGRILIIE